MDLIVDGLTKSYNNIKVLKNISFNLKSGDCIGLIGDNGAGKTTLIRLLTTLLKPDEGIIKLNNKDITLNQVAYRKVIGYMPEDAGLYNKYSAYLNLKFYMQFYNNVTNESIITALNDFGLTSNKKAGSFSKGMKQKVLFLKAILNDPDILFLDEPLNGLDPSIRLKVKTILNDMQNQDKIIILSSHILSEIYEICNRFIILKSGEIKMDLYKSDIKTEDNLKENYKEIMEL